jgi:uncharacterized lipoprotein YddW (UPF0748 family)
MRFLTPLLAISFALVFFGCGDPAPQLKPVTPEFAPMRAIWVTRWEYRTETDVRDIVSRSADAGFDTILFQVRGEATAFYDSAKEPWARELGGEDPGFDPLAVAIEVAHERGVALHAWINVVPAWYGLEPPVNEAHLWHTKPEWFWWDQHGQRQALSDKFYVSLNPCLPEVRLYLSRVIGELAARYAIDGLHLDYLRFPNEAPAVPKGSGLDYPRDAATLALYFEATGKAPDEDLAAWSAWRTQQVTTLLAEIRAVVHRVKPKIPIGAAVGSVPEYALSHFQDVQAWMNEGLVDIVFPMNYTADAALFAERMAYWSNVTTTAQIVMGLLVYTGETEGRIAEVQAAKEAFDSIAIFAYFGLFDSANENLTAQDDAARAERATRLESFLPLLR